MNILIEPFYIGFLQLLISFLLFSGLAISGKFINNFLPHRYQNTLFDILISIILYSQLLKIIVYLNFFEQFYIFFSFLLIILGVFNLKKIISDFHYKNFSFQDSWFSNIILILLFLLFLISISPPSMADALDYHYGIPLYLLKYHQIPSINFWLYANVGGNGDIFNSIALFLKTDNFVSVLQFLSIILFLSFLKKEVKDKNKFIFISIFTLSSPTILQLLSGPKFMILPQIMTSIALYFLIKNKKIEVIDFIFISILLMGAAQFKSSFLITGFLIGILTFLRALKHNHFKILFFSFLLLSFFFLPTAIWNFNQIINFNLVNIFTLMPDSMMDSMKIFRENNFIYPLNIFIPSSLGKISSVLGFQILLLLLFINNSKKFNIILYIISLTIILHYFLGMNVGRMYYEYILWGSIAFIFVKDKKFNYNFYSLFILPQTILIIIFSTYFASISFPSLFSYKERDNFMIKNTFYYEGIKWVNETLPQKSKIISTIRPVSLLKNEFAPTDILDFDVNDYNFNEYLQTLKKGKFDYILLVDKPQNSVFKNCIGDEFGRSKKLKKSTRNPFNRNLEYNLSIYHFNYQKLPGCFKR